MCQHLPNIYPQLQSLQHPGAPYLRKSIYLTFPIGSPIGISNWTSTQNLILSFKPAPNFFSISMYLPRFCSGWTSRNHHWLFHFPYTHINLTASYSNSNFKIYLGWTTSRHFHLLVRVTPISHLGPCNSLLSSCSFCHHSSFPPIPTVCFLHGSENVLYKQQVSDVTPYSQPSSGVHHILSEDPSLPGPQGQHELAFSLCSDHTGLFWQFHPLSVPSP